jgi:hypothetical protein
MLSLLKYTMSDTYNTNSFSSIVPPCKTLCPIVRRNLLFILLEIYLYHLSVFILKASKVHAISLDGVVSNV